MPAAVLFDALLKNVTDTVLILDADDRIAFCGGQSEWADIDALKGCTLASLFRNETARLLNTLSYQLRRNLPIQLTEFYLTPAHAPELIPLGLNRSYLFQVRASLVEDYVMLVLQDVSQQRAAAALANKHRTHDPLTRTYNRKAMLPVLNQAIAQSQRYEYNCSLAMIDVDDLEGINLRAGWAAGDQVLQQLAAMLEKIKRTSDFLVRIGEDRFALMLPETSAEQSMLVGNRILDQVRQLRIGTERGLMNFSVSIGIASLRDKGDNTEKLLRRASASLQAAKDEGGNQVVAELESA